MTRPLLVGFALLTASAATAQLARGTTVIDNGGALSTQPIAFPGARPSNSQALYVGQSLGEEFGLLSFTAGATHLLSESFAVGGSVGVFSGGATDFRSTAASLSVRARYYFTAEGAGPHFFLEAAPRFFAQRLPGGFMSDPETAESFGADVSLGALYAFEGGAAVEARLNYGYTRFANSRLFTGDDANAHGFGLAVAPVGLLTPGPGGAASAVVSEGQWLVAPVNIAFSYLPDGDRRFTFTDLQIGAVRMANPKFGYGLTVASQRQTERCESNEPLGCSPIPSSGRAFQSLRTTFYLQPQVRYYATPQKRASFLLELAGFGEFGRSVNTEFRGDWQQTFGATIFPAAAIALRPGVSAEIGPHYRVAFADGEATNNLGLQAGLQFAVGGGGGEGE